MATLKGLPFNGTLVSKGVLRVEGDRLDETMRERARSRGWMKEPDGPRWSHPGHPEWGHLPLL